MPKAADPLNEYLEILKSFEVNKVEYILIGGLAVILHGMPRFTIDMDVFVKISSQNIENLRKALKTIFKEDKSIDEITPQELTKYAVIRYGPPEGNYYIDIMTKIGDAFGYEDLEYEIFEIKGVKVRIATAETLLKMKKNTIREKDKMDVFFLKEKIKKRFSKK